MNAMNIQSSPEKLIEHDGVLVSRHDFILVRNFVRSVIYSLFFFAAALGVAILNSADNDVYDRYFSIIDRVPFWPHFWAALILLFSVTGMIIYTLGHFKKVDHRTAAINCVAIGIWYIIWGSGLFLGNAGYGFIVHFGLASLHFAAGRYLYRMEDD